MLLIRFLIVGDAGVGKTSILLRFHEDLFHTDQKTTIGVDYRAKELTLDGESIKLQIWDTAGQERFRSMTNAFYHKAQGVVIMFDVSQRNSFLSLPEWIADVLQNAPPNCIKVLCANKIDLPLDSWNIRQEEWLEYSKKVGIPLIETSASTGSGVQDLFLLSSREVIKHSREDLVRLGSEVNRDSSQIFEVIDPPPKKRMMGCC